MKIIPKQFLVFFSFDVFDRISVFCAFWPFRSFHSKF